MSTIRRRIADAITPKPSYIRRTRTLSDQLRLAETIPTLNAKPRGDTAHFLAETREALEKFPGMAGEISIAEHDVRTAVESIFWYHTIEMPGGITSDGLFDHRPLVPHYGIPEDLQGKRVLDVGLWDGFWAFEFERRGAHVQAIDVEGLAEVDLPKPYKEALRAAGLKQHYGNGFEIARNALGSSVERHHLNVYDLRPDTLGTFDLVHIGDLVLHLEFPTEALRHVRAVTDELAILSIPFAPELDRRQVRYLGGWWNVVWWIPSLDTAVQMVFDAGFSSVTVHALYELRAAKDEPGYWRAVIHATP